jgi:hypothetical protein
VEECAKQETSKKQAANIAHVSRFVYCSILKTEALRSYVTHKT